jgi:hypothetical protein
MDPNLLLTAIAAHAWPTVVGCALVLIVYLAKLPAVKAQWERLPAWSRPLLPVLLGLLSGVGEALSTSQPWLPALVGGILAALPALAVALPSPVIHRAEIVEPDTTPGAAPKG